MKIGRFRTPDGDLWGVVEPDRGVVRLLEEPIESWAVRAAADEAIKGATGEEHSLDDVRVLPPVMATSRVIGVGMNYRAHLDKFGVAVPPAPLVFFKPHSALVGNSDEISYPATTEKLDFEIELAAVVGAERLAHAKQGTRSLLGYTVGNDISARDARSPLGGPDLFAMKALDSATPLGPWIATLDEFGPGVVDLEMILRVNDEVRQRDRTSNMIWTVDELLYYIDQRVRLTTGDVVLTGTTAGVGMEDDRYLEPGDVVEAEIEGIGVLHNVVGARASDRA